MPLGIASMTLSMLFSNYIKVLINLQNLATSSCVGALVAGTSFQEIYENLPRVIHGLNMLHIYLL